MSRKRYTPAQIIGMLREAEVLLSQGRATGSIVRIGLRPKTMQAAWILETGSH